MIKVVCQHCGRYYEKEGNAKGVSHGMCARCMVSDPENRDNASEEELKEDIAYELDSGIVWQGPDNFKFSKKDLKIYERLLGEALSERGDGKRR